MKRIFAITIASLIFAGFPWPVLAAWPAVADASATPRFRQIHQDVRVETLAAVLEAYGSPLANEAKTFVFYADTYKLDWKLVAAIAGVESTFGKHIPSGSYNAWGWAVYTGTQRGVAFTNWKQGIATVSEGLRKNYLDEGAQTLEQIGGRYAASRAWAKSVRFFLTKIEEFTPTSSRTLAFKL